MKLSFFTPPQCMTFVDSVTHQLTNAGQLKPGVIYDVFAVLKNEDSIEYPNAQINVTHTAFGIGLPGGTSYIVQPDPIDVPPALNPAQPGLATFQFQFIAPPAGHGCLVAKIVLNNATLNQNLTVLTAPHGTSTISFLVFGNPTADETMVLTLEQRLENGTLVTPANHWPHQFVVPPPLSFNQISSDQIALALPRGSNAFSIGINVTIPAAATDPHTFFVRGTVNGVDQGSVSLLVKPDPFFIKPAPYVHCGYESPDIVLVDPQGRVVPFFGNPISDTVLLPNTDYAMRAIIHNDSPTPAFNTLVRFWESFAITIAGVELGVELDRQTVTVPPHGTVEVTSRRPFHSGAKGAHRCAIVSVYNSQSSTCPSDYPTFDAVYHAGTTWTLPGTQGPHGATAWRNCDSLLVFLNERWQFEVVAAPHLRLPGPVPPLMFNVESILIPHDWQMLPEVIEANQTLQIMGVQTRFPAFLLPKVREKFKKVDLEVEVKAENVRVEALQLAGAATQPTSGKTAVLPAVPMRQFNLHGSGEKPLPISISGKLPSEARDGDIVLVRCAAIYPKSGDAPQTRVEFTEALHVMRH
jgi:hypothetical protein